MKACPGLRSGIDRSGSLSFAIRGIPSPIRPPIRHSGEGRNPGEVWFVAMTLELSHQPAHLIFKPWCAGGSRNPAPAHGPELTL